MHVKEGYFFTPPKQVSSPTSGPPPPCKQALTNNDLLVLTQWIGALNPIFRIIPSLKGLLKNYKPRAKRSAIKLSMLSILNVSGMFQTTILLCPLNVLQTAGSDLKKHDRICATSRGKI